MSICTLPGSTCRKRPSGLVGLVALAWGLLGHLTPARAEIDLKFSGWVSSDIRYRIAGVEPRDPPTPSQWQLLKTGWSRNENRVRAALNLSLGTKVKAVADAELMAFGFSDVRNLDAATLRDRVDPYFFEFHAAYVDINNLVKGLDLRIGRQVVPWGAADKFNPVSNLNTMDLSDPLLFGRALANNMIRVDYTPITDLSFTAVVIPVFRPAQLPRTAPIALLDPLRPPPISDPDLLAAIDRDRAILSKNLTVEASVLEPEISARNTQFGLRAAYKILEQDVAVSYYRGRFGIPTPAWSVITGKLPNALVRTAVVYPRVDIVGAELAGSIDKLGGLGYWVEAAVNIPEQVEMAFYDELFNPSGMLRQVSYTKMGDRYLPTFLPLGERAFRPNAVEPIPFVKATVGLDYTLAGGKVYLNFQYVHGFIDEFGAGQTARPRKDPTDILETPRMEAKLGDYLVGGLDVKLLSDRLLMRLFGVFKLPSFDLVSKKFDDWAPTGVLFPQVVWTVWDATELSIGSFVMLGDRSTKFGDPAAGGIEVFAKAKVSF